MSKPEGLSLLEMYLFELLVSVCLLGNNQHGFQWTVGPNTIAFPSRLPHGPHELRGTMYNSCFLEEEFQS